MKGKLKTKVLFWDSNIPLWDSVAWEFFDIGRIRSNRSEQCTKDLITFIFTKDEILKLGDI